MSAFEFVSVLMSIVVGLGITRLLSSASNLVEHRASIRFDFTTLVWATNILLYLVIYWWVVVGNWRDRTTWSFPSFVSLFLYGVFLYFCASLILPEQADPRLDLASRFDSIRRPFFAMWLLVVCAEVTDSFLKGVAYVLTELGPAWFGIVGGSAVLGIIALRVRDRRFHRLLAVAVFVTYAAWTLSMFRSI